MTMRAPEMMALPVVDANKLPSRFQIGDRVARRNESDPLGTVGAVDEVRFTMSGITYVIDGKAYASHLVEPAA